MQNHKTITKYKCLRQSGTVKLNSKSKQMASTNLMKQITKKRKKFILKITSLNRRTVYFRNVQMRKKHKHKL